MVAMSLLTHSSKYSSPHTHTNMQVYTQRCRDLPNRPYFCPLPHLEHTWHSHTSIPGCVLSSRQSACCTAHNSYHPIHPLPPPYLSCHPDVLAPRLQTLSCSAPCNPPRRRLLLFPFFQFGWGAGSERATHSPTPFYFLAAFTPTLRTVSITLLLAHPLLRWPAEGKISIFICFFAGYVSLYPLLVPTPFSLLSATLLSPLPPWRFSLSFVLDFFFLFFLFLSPSYFHLPFLTAPRRRASARLTEREWIEEGKTDREGKWECEGRGVEQGKGSKRRRLLRRRRRRRLRRRRRRRRPRRSVRAFLGPKCEKERSRRKETAVGGGRIERERRTEKESAELPLPYAPPRTASTSRAVALT